MKITVEHDAIQRRFLARLAKAELLTGLKVVAENGSTGLVFENGDLIHIGNYPSAVKYVFEQEEKMLQDNILVQ